MHNRTINKIDPLPIQSMAQLTVLKVLPRILGHAAAYPWRFWTRGDEFYAGRLNALKLHHTNKMSFHSSGTGYENMGKISLNRSAGVALGGGWVHIFHLNFVFLPDALRAPPILPESLSPSKSQKESLYVIECTADSTLRIDFYINRERNHPPCPWSRNKEEQIAELPLRSGGVVSVSFRASKMEDWTRSYVDIARSIKCRVPDPSGEIEEGAYSEFDTSGTREKTGNHAIAIPLPADWLVPIDGP